MAKFRIIGGSHTDEGFRFDKGDIIKSEHPLDRVFVNKFERVDNSYPETLRTREKQVRLVNVKEAELPPERVDAPAATPKSRTLPPIVLSKPKEIVAEKSDPAKDGTNKTDMFPRAQEEDFVIFKMKGLFYVYDAEDLNAPLNDEGVQKAAVDGIITEALKSAKKK